MSSAARRARSGLRAPKGALGAARRAHLDRRDGERQPKDPLGKADAVHGSVLPKNVLSNIHAASRFPLGLRLIRRIMGRKVLRLVAAGVDAVEGRSKKAAFSGAAQHPCGRPCGRSCRANADRHPGPVGPNTGVHTGHGAPML